MIFQPEQRNLLQRQLEVELASAEAKMRAATIAAEDAELCAACARRESATELLPRQSESGGLKLAMAESWGSP